MGAQPLLQVEWKFLQYGYNTPEPPFQYILAGIQDFVLTHISNWVSKY
jgi:hypothetical protein